VGTACVIPGSVADGIVFVPQGRVKQLSVEHPSGEFSLEMEVDETNGQVNVARSSLIRTARALFRGEILIPASIWDGVVSSKGQTVERA
jgi:4-oxalomesaconate tautomerase